MSDGVTVSQTSLQRNGQAVLCNIPQQRVWQPSSAQNHDKLARTSSLSRHALKVPAQHVRDRRHIRAARGALAAHNPRQRPKRPARRAGHAAARRDARKLWQGVAWARRGHELGKECIHVLLCVGSALLVLKHTRCRSLVLTDSCSLERARRPVVYSVYELNQVWQASSSYRGSEGGEGGLNCYKTHL